MKKLIGSIVAIMLLTSLLTGCAGIGNRDNSAAQPENESLKTEADNISDSAEAWPRTYIDAAGSEIVLDKKPEKIALLFFHNYEPLFALGEAPMAATDVETVYKAWGSLIPYSETVEIIDLGQTRSPNLEKLMEVEPDLILYVDSLHSEILDNLQKIAPTIAVAGGPLTGYSEEWSTWQGVIREYGKILGKEEEAETEITRLEGLISDAKKKLSAYEDKTFVFIRLQEKVIHSWMPDFAFNPVSGLGLKSPYEETSQMSLESLAALDPDFLIIYNQPTNDLDEAEIEDLNANSSVWRSLSAVKAGNVIPVDHSSFSGGPLGMEIGIKTIIEAIEAK